MRETALVMTHSHEVGFGVMHLSLVRVNPMPLPLSSREKGSHVFCNVLDWTSRKETHGA